VSGSEARSELRELLHPAVDRDTYRWIAALRESEPVWPPPISRAGPTLRNPFTGTGDRGVRHELAAVDGCGGPSRKVPCLPVHRNAVACPRCRRPTPVGERVIGPRLPACTCYAALCAH
jgi:hypothetical protein